jgi:hypothetical protein
MTSILLAPLTGTKFRNLGVSPKNPEMNLAKQSGVTTDQVEKPGTQRSGVEAHSE